MEIPQDARKRPYAGEWNDFFQGFVSDGVSGNELCETRGKRLLG
jgi:hypothetical protein